MDNIPESHMDLLTAKFATLATIGTDGRPQQSELWFLAENETIAISLNEARQKLRNLRRNPACSLLILDLADPHRYLEFRGDADIHADPDYRFADRVAAKYGIDLRAMDRPGESRAKVTIRSTRIRAWPPPS